MKSFVNNPYVKEEEKTAANLAQGFFRLSTFQKLFKLKKMLIFCQSQGKGGMGVGLKVVQC